MVHVNPPRDAIEQWVEALRSGRYRQGRFDLQSGNSFCCFGVAVKEFTDPAKILLNEDSAEIMGTLPKHQPSAPQWLKDIEYLIVEYRADSADSDKGLIWLNDSGEYSFNEIADVIQAVYLEGALD